MLGGINANDPVRYGASYKSTSAMALNTPDTIFTPAANVNGAVVWAASFYTYNAATNPLVAALAKTSAPTSNIDGDVILASDKGTVVAAAGPFEKYGKLSRPVFIPAGKGLYFIAGASAETVAQRFCNYTLL